MIIDNILKVADVHSVRISGQLRDYLNQFITYRDARLSEHLINVNEAREEFDENEHENPEELRAELVKLKGLLDDNDCAYLRIIN